MYIIILKLELLDRNLQRLTSLIGKPSPTLRNIGSSTSSMYQPKLFNICAIANAQNGIEVTILRHGTRFLAFGSSAYKSHTIFHYIKYL